jgi:hypothetical protein
VKTEIYLEYVPSARHKNSFPYQGCTDIFRKGHKEILKVISQKFHEEFFIKRKSAGTLQYCEPYV